MKNSLLLLLLFLSQLAFAQNDQPEGAEVDYKDVAGNPYLFKDWSDGVIRFTSGRSLNQFKLKFDCARNQLVLQFDGSSFAAESKVREFVMYPKSGKKKDSLVFRKGFPAIDKLTNDTYYQVMFEGKVLLLRLFARDIIEEKKIVSSGSNNKRMEEVERFYFFRDGAMSLLPQDRSDLLKLFPNQKDPLTQFISDRQLKMRSAEDFLAFAQKYNELL